MKTLTLAMLLVVGCGGDKAPPGVPGDRDVEEKTAVLPPGRVSETPTTSDPAPTAPTDPAPGRPKNVSFAQVTGVFESRGCVSCHSGNGIGRDLGDLTLDGGDPLIFRELTEEPSPTYQSARVLTRSPDASLLLSVPSLKNAPDKHPVTVFESTSDRDYQLLLVWIQEGARSN